MRGQRREAAGPYPQTLQQPRWRVVLGIRPTFPPPHRRSGSRPPAPHAGPHTCGAAHGLRLRIRSPSLAFKRALKKTRPTQSRERGRGPAEGVCAGRGSAGLVGWGGGGRSAGKGVIGREALPGSRREGRIGLGSAPPGGAVCLQPPPPALVPPSSRSRAVQAAGAAAAGKRAEQPRAAEPPCLSSLGRGLCRRARGKRDRETAAPSESQPHKVPRPGRGRQRWGAGPCLTRARRASRTSR